MFMERYCKKCGGLILKEGFIEKIIKLQKEETIKMKLGDFKKRYL